MKESFFPGSPEISRAQGPAKAREKKEKKKGNFSDSKIANFMRNFVEESFFPGDFEGARSRQTCDPASLLQESLGPFGPEMSRECPRECPRKWGVSERVSDGVFPGPFGPRAPECPKSVPRVSAECQKGVPDTLRTLSGHFLGTLERGARRAPGTPRRTLLEHPPFSGTLSGTLGDTSGPKGPRDSCSRPAGSQRQTSDNITLRESYLGNTFVPQGRSESTGARPDARPSAVPKRGRSKRGRSPGNTQMSAKERK